LPVLPDSPEISLTVSDFVALLNQTLEYSLAGVVVVGELANLRVSKNRWLYFDLKDETCTVKFFGTVYQLPGPLEDGMMLRVKGNPRLHNQYGFSVNVTSIQPAGEGTIKRAAQLLEAKLQAEGLFDAARKRPLPHPPQRIGLITSRQSAAYADFIKILDARWRGMDVEVIDVQVQGEAAVPQITAALEQFNAEAEPPEVLVMIRGGGSPEDLAAFSSEQVTRAVAASRVPTLVAIGHEIDVSLAELAADQRASTPSNAAELLVPDRKQLLSALPAYSKQLHQGVLQRLHEVARTTHDADKALTRLFQDRSQGWKLGLERQQLLLAALSPTAILQRGYAIVRSDGQALRGVQALRAGAIVDVQLAKGSFAATVNDIDKKTT
jgi:exodeoxyribonuclease VII large subunit